MRADGGSLGDGSGLGPAPNRLAFAIIVTVLCCMPFGIPAIVFAAKSMSANEARRYREAHEASKQATMWCWISFAIGLVVVGGYVGLTILSVAAGAAGAGHTP